MHAPTSDCTLNPKCDLSAPCPLRVCFPILLDGDLALSPEHLGPAYLAAVVRAAGAQVRIIEVAPGADASAINEVRLWSPDIVGMSLTTAGAAHARQFGAQLRMSLGKRPFMVAGGPLASHLGGRLLSQSGWDFLDAAVRGDGEIPLLRLAEAIHQGSTLERVPSFVYRRDGVVRETPLSPGITQLDLLPDPVRDQLEFHGGRLNYLRLSTSRGCTSHCTFCNALHTGNRLHSGTKAWRGASPQRIVDEMERLIARYGVSAFEFVDSTFEDPGGGMTGKKRVREIAEEILKRRLDVFFNVCMQAAHWSDDDAPLIDLLWRAGLEKVFVGIESGTEVGLRRWQKKSTVADNVRILRLLRAARIYVAFGFIAFHPWSSFEEIRENQRFLRNNIGHNLRRFTTVLELYPGAKVIKELRDCNLLLPEFDTDLNPYAFRFADRRIENLANSLNSVCRANYRTSRMQKKALVVFEFETLDVALHDFSSKMFRRFGAVTLAQRILGEFDAQVDASREELSRFNFNFIGEMTMLAEDGRLTSAETQLWARRVDEFYTKKIGDLEQLKLAAGMRMRQCGFNVRANPQTPDP